MTTFEFLNKYKEEKISKDTFINELKENLDLETIQDDESCIIIKLKNGELYDIQDKSDGSDKNLIHIENISRIYEEMPLAEL